MKKIILLLLIGLSINRISAQGSLQVTAGANITGSGASWIVLNDMNVVNNGSILLSTSGNTVKTTGTLNTTQSGTGTTQLNNLTNNTSATFTLAEPVSLYNQLNLTTGTLASAGFLNLKSTATNTAMVLPVPVGATATGDVTAERFISAASARSAWRLLTAPLRSGTGTNGTIFANWQNNGVNPPPPGIDTRVTGPVNNGGLDAITFGPSMRWFDMPTGTLQNVTTTNNPAITPLFTTAPSAANMSYFTFIDGDRTLPPGGPANTTTLSAMGNLQIGNQTFATNPAADGFAMIGNPYASPVDLDLFRQTNTTLGSNIKATYYYWDPYLTGVYGVGAYVTVSYDGTGSSYTITPGTAAERHLQSGQAMYVQTTTPAAGTPSVTFTETQKSTTNVNNIFRTSSGNIESMAINLNVISSGSPILVDGIVAKFDNSYAAAIDNYDATKLYNVGESVAFIREGKAFAIERRPMVKSEDILYLNVERLKTNKDYQFEIKPDLNAPGISAWLKDNYLKTTTPIDVNAPTAINFTINSDAASTGANRFSIVFAKPAVVQAGKPTISVYPNPVTNGIINLQMSNMPQGLYNVRVVNSQGQTVLIKQINHAAGSSTKAIKLDNGVKGAYHLEVTRPDKTKFSTKVIAQ